MTLNEWIAREGRGAKSRLARDTGMSWQGIHALSRGGIQASVDTAKRIAEATKGDVSIEEVLGLPRREEPAPSGKPGAAA